MMLVAKAQPPFMASLELSALYKSHHFQNDYYHLDVESWKDVFTGTVGSLALC